MPKPSEQNQASKAEKLLEDWLKRGALVALSLHLNVGVLSFLGEVFQRRDEHFYFRNRSKDFMFVFSPFGLARIRFGRDGARRSLELDTHRYLIEGIRTEQYDSIMLQECSAGTLFSSLEELAARIHGSAD